MHVEIFIIEDIIITMEFSIRIAGREIPYWHAGIRIKPGDAKAFGQALTAYRRQEVGPRFDTFAQQMGIGVFHYTQIESGRFPFKSADQLRGWLDKLNLTPDTREHLHFMAGWVPDGKSPEEARKIETFFGYALIRRVT